MVSTTSLEGAKVEITMSEETILLYPSPGMGHLASMVEFAKLIAAYQPSLAITILLNALPDMPISTYDPLIASVTATFPSIAFRHLPPPALPPEPSSYSFARLSFELSRLSLPETRHILQTMSQESSLKAFFIDFFCNATFEEALSLGIPTYFFYTSGACSLATFLSIPEIQQFALTHEPHSILNIPGLPPFPLGDYPIACLEPELLEAFTSTAMHMARSNGIVTNTFRALEERTLKAISESQCVPDGPTAPVYSVGPLVGAFNQTLGAHGKEHECLRWLDSQPSKSVIFLCFGSMGVFSGKQLKEMAVGLEKSGHRFLWVVRSPPAEDKTASLGHTNLSEPNLEDLFPNGFLERTKKRGLVVKNWAPQVAVLSHGSVGGFVTHCGWNSILEAVCAGVPMVAWPLYAEQKVNRSALVGEMRLGLRLNESEENGFVSAAELEERVRELMDSDSVSGNKIRERVGAMKEAAAAATSDGGSARTELDELVRSWKLIRKN